MSTLSENELIAQIRLINTEGIGAISFYKLYHKYGSAQTALENLPPRYKASSLKEAQKEYEKAKKGGINIISFADSRYPQALKELSDSPPLLYAYGNTDLLAHKNSISIVGSRNASINGRKIASRLAYELTENNILVISGMARGIDTSAHKGAMYALNQQGPTIAVLGTGIDCPYPEENKDLYKQIAAQGLIISELPLGTTPQAQNFPRRNRIIAGLSLGTLVVEANLQSGSLITARLALEQNREVFAIPGSPTESRALGSNKLIKEGAVLVDCVDDILEHLKTTDSQLFTPKENRQDFPLQEKLLDKEENNADIPEEKKTTTDIRNYLSKEGVYMDELIRISHLPANELSAILIDMELSGEIMRLPGNKIALIKK